MVLGCVEAVELRQLEHRVLYKVEDVDIRVPTTLSSYL